MSDENKQRRVGSLLAKRQQTTELPPQPPATPTDDPVAKAILAQAESMDRLAKAISSQPAPVFKAEMQPAPPRRYMITVEERDKDKLPKSYLIEPLSKI